MLTANGSAVESVLARLEGVKSTGGKHQACCPNHDDAHASLSISEGDDGRILLNCHAGCATADVVRSLGMTMADLAPPSMRNGHSGNGRREIVAVYDYRDADGSLISQAVRFSPKGFSQRNAAGEWTTKGCKVVPYRLPELVAADPTEPIFIVEGEKDVDRLRSLGLVATCNAAGAGKWRTAHADCIPEGSHVVIIPDNDPAGRKHAEQVEKSLRRRAKSVRVLELPDLAEKGDVSDWLDGDGTVKKLRALAAAADNPFRKSGVEKFTFAQLREAYPTLADPVVDGLARMGETMNINADPKIGKSWMGYGLMLSVITGRDWLDYFPTTRGRALLIDNELPRSVLAYRIAEVAAAMGIEPHEYENNLEIWPLRGNLRSIEELAREFDDVPPGQFIIVVCDARYRFPTGGNGENDNTATTEFFNTVDRLASQTNALWVLIHHANKGNQSEKKITDVGAGAGAQSRAADAHLVVRPHEDDGVVVLDGVVRSFAPPKPLALRWTWPLWQLDEWADTSKLAGRLPANEQRQNEKDREGQNAIVKALAAGPLGMNDLCRKASMGKGRANRLIGQLEADGNVVSETAKIHHNNATVYRLVEGEV